MLELLYTALLYLIQPLIWIRLWVRGRKAPAYRKRWGERYGFYRRPLKPGGIMLHSVSVGETLAAIPLVRALRHRYPDLPITVTTMTPTGSERVQSAFGNDVQHVYLPYDLPDALNRFLNKVDPKLVLIMETELWPNLIAALHKRHIPLVIANARLSARSAAGYAKLGKFVRTLLRRITLIAAQNEEDGERFVALGAKNNQVAKAHHLYVTQVCGRFLRQRHTFVQGEHGFLAGAGGDGQNDMVEHLRCARHNIEMTVSNRIKRTWINRPFLHDSPQCVFGGR